MLRLSDRIWHSKTFLACWWLRERLPSYRVNPSSALCSTVRTVNRELFKNWRTAQTVEQLKQSEHTIGLTLPTTSKTTYFGLWLILSGLSAVLRCQYSDVYYCQNIRMTWWDRGKCYIFLIAKSNLFSEWPKNRSLEKKLP